jgi:uncharacterized protein (TIGR03032 family)
MGAPASGAAAGQAGEVIRCDLAGDFAAWMARAGGSIALTTYQAGKVVLVGWDGRQVTILPRNFDRAMGLAVAGRRMLLATRHKLWVLADSPVLAADFDETHPGRYDALYLPRATFYIGGINAHDVDFGADGPWVVNTRFSCLAAPGLDYSFLPRWHPPFITRLLPEDRCHLNGLCMEGGQPRYVTAFGQSDEPGGWRERRFDGGIVIDVPSGETLARGLCMPHSPRLHDGALWVLASGRGELLRLDRTDYRAEVVCGLPGFVRGLDFVGPYALIGLGTLRSKHLFSGLPVQTRHPELICGLAVVDICSGQVVGRMDFKEGCTEMYDVRFLPGVARPMILNDERPETQHAVIAPDGAYWIRPSDQG